MQNLDQQMKQWSTRLRDDVGVIEHSNTLATQIMNEVRQLSFNDREEIRNASVIPIKSRLEELIAFQAFTELVPKLPDHPAIARAEVITQNYICFIYLGDACFKLLRRVCPTGSVTRKCCKFLTDNPVRAFRNAMAHSNWTYTVDFDGIEYFAKKGENKDDPMEKFIVTQIEINFWHSLAKCVAYAAYQTIVKHTENP